MTCTACGSEEAAEISTFGDQHQRWACNQCGTTWRGPEMVTAHVRYPDDPPSEFVYRADGSVAQTAGVVRTMQVPVWTFEDGPTRTVRIEHSDGWTELD
jgi:hypothetical protein